MRKNKKQKDLTIINKPSDSSISYSGKVTVTVKKGHTTISKNTYKNTGGLPLWKFICHSLAGQYADAESYRPNKIVLFNCASDIPPTEGFIESTKNSFEILTLAVNANRTASVLPTTDGTNWAATLHFIIPPAYINLNKVTNAVALYSKDFGEVTDENKAKYSACYLFVDKEDPSKWADTIDLANIKGDYNILIDWEMSVDNR